MATHSMTFDTLIFAKKLEASGIQQKKAEAVVETIRDVVDENLDKIFTKKDGKLLKAELKADITEVKHDLLKLKSDIVIWVVGLLFAQTAIIVSLIKFIH